MRCNPLRWLWGLPFLAALGWFAVNSKQIPIETDLTHRVEHELKASGFQWAHVAFAGRDGVLSGVAADEADPQRAYDVVRGVWGVRAVENVATVVAKVEPYEWSARNVDGRLELSGYVPNDSVRADILKAVKDLFHGVPVVDKMQLARGVPSLPAWLAGIKFGLTQITGLKGGEARLKNLSLAVAGEAGDLTRYTRVKRALASEMPAGVKLVDDRVLAPIVKPFVWTAKQSGGHVELGGFVPVKARDEVLAAAKAAFPKATTIDDKAEAGEGAAQGYAAAATTLLRELSHLETGSAEIRDNAASIQGLALTQDEADQARRDLHSLPKGFQLSEAIRVKETGPAPVEPYTTSVTTDEASVTLTGFAPSEIARDKLVQIAQAQFPNRKIVNRLQIAPGAPDGWLKCFEGALGGAGKLTGGKAALVGRHIDIAGSTGNEKLAGQLSADVASAVGGSCDPTVRVDLRAEAQPNLTWRAAYDGAGVTIDGDVVSAAVKAQLAGTARRVFGGKPVVDRSRIVEASIPNWPSIAEQGLIALATLDRGTATFERQQLRVSGHATSAAVAADVRKRLAANTVKGFTESDEIQVAPPVVTPPAAVPSVLTAKAGACEKALKDVTREGMIHFERASATLTEDSYSTLDKLAQVAKTCSDATVEIEGHTDSEGTPERNQALSERRAQSVVTYLTGDGVDAGRLKPVGYGDTRPVAPNDTAANRAKNRRIEFTVKAP